MPRDEQTSDKDNMIATMAWPVGLHALLPLFWLGFVLHTIPMILEAHARSGSELPASTRTALQFTNLAGQYPHIFLLMLILFLAADAVIYYRALRSGGRDVARRWSMFVLLVQGVLGVLTLLAFFLPIKTMIS